jgi:alginate O-acetyltransferase complex protein AlgJ
MIMFKRMVVLIGLALFTFATFSLATPYNQMLETGVTVGQNGWLFHVAEFGRYTQERPQDINEKLEHIAAIKDLLKARNIEFVVALVPAKLHLYEAQLPADLPLTETIRSRYTRARIMLEQLGVNAPDLLGPMQAATKDSIEAKYPVYQKLDHHFSSRGALIAAKAVTDFVAQHLKLEDVPAVKFDLNALPESTYQESSLRPRLPKNLQSQFPPESYIPYELKRTSAQNSLLGDVAPRVVLVGSSASKGGSQWPFEYAIPHNLDIDVTNAAVAGHGPWLPLEDYLRNEGFQHHPPKLIIWQLWEAFLLDVDQAALPQDWMLNLAPLALGACKDGQAVNVSDGTDALELELSGQAGQYFNAEISTKGLERIAVEILGQTGSRRLEIPLGSAGKAYNLSVPLQLHSTQTATRMRILKGQANAIQVQNAQVCTIPQTAKRVLEPSSDLHEFVIANAPHFELSGFADPEANNVRWALGPESQIGFWSFQNHTANLKLEAYNPIENQTVIILWNDRVLEEINGLKAGGSFRREYNLNGLPGKNRLKIRVKKQNGQGSDFAKGDSRSLSIMFNTLEFNFR